MLLVLLYENSFCHDAMVIFGIADTTVWHNSQYKYSRYSDSHPCSCLGTIQQRMKQQHCNTERQTRWGTGYKIISGMTPRSLSLLDLCQTIRRTFMHKASQLCIKNSTSNCYLEKINKLIAGRALTLSTNISKILPDYEATWIDDFIIDR